MELKWHGHGWSHGAIDRRPSSQCTSFWRRQTRSHWGHLATRRRLGHQRRHCARIGSAIWCALGDGAFGSKARISAWGRQLCCNIRPQPCTNWPVSDLLQNARGFIATQSSASFDGSRQCCEFRLKSVACTKHGCRWLRVGNIRCTGILGGGGLNVAANNAGLCRL